MGVELVALLVSMFASLAAGGGAALARVLYRRLRGIEEPEPLPYAQRLSQEMAALTEVSRKVDALLEELRTVATTREAAARKLEADLEAMQQREGELRRRIDELKDVPLPVAEHLAKLMEPGEKRSALRDYVLFGAGVLVSTIIGIILEIAL